MKMNKLIYLLFFPFCINLSFAQKAPDVSNPVLQKAVYDNQNKYVLPIDKVSVKGSYPLGVSDIKTIHIVFPSEIKEVDAGTSSVIIEITQAFNNVLRVKSGVNKEFDETTLTVLTADGGLYSFLVNYDKYPEILNINIGNNLSSDVLASKDLGINYFLKTNYLLPTYNQSAQDILYYSEKTFKEKGFIKNVGVQNLMISSFLKGVYYHNGITYFKMEFINDSEIDYTIDFVKLYIKDKDVLKKMTSQEEELKLIEQYPSDKVLKAKSSYIFSFATPFITLSEDKKVDIEVYEKNGGRHLRFPVDSKIIAKSKSL